jgi:tetratricopeptide (TPR) repeat protein
MAPEQATGSTATVGVPTDVFGLGAILYELLAGRAPFTGQSTDEVLTRARAADAPAPRSLVSTVPRALDAVCRKAIAKAPGDRYQTVPELVDDVRRYLADEPVSAYREPLRVRAGRWARRHRTLVATSAVALVVLGGAALGFALWRDAKRHEKIALIYEKQSHAMAAAHAGDVDRAVGLFREYEAVAEAADEPHFEAYARSHRTALEKFAEFRAKAAAALKEGAHNIRFGKGPDPILVKCEEALTIAGMLNPDFEQSRVAIGFGVREHDETIATGRELLVLAALRLAMFDTKDEAAKANTRKALGYLDRAAALKLYGPGGQEITGPTAGELMLRMFWHRRLGENKEADEAGDRMTAMVKADGGFRTARDYYIFGSITLNIVKKPKDALNAYREALKREPGHYGALFGSYLCHTELKDLPGQVAALTGCLAVRAGDAELYTFRGVALFSQGQYDAAFHDFDAAVLRNPESALAYYWRGRARVMGEKWAEAEADFGQAVRRDATLVNARSWRAIVRGKIGQADGAAEDAEAAVTEHPTSADTLFYAARAYAQAAKAPATAEKYGARSVELLRQALDRGFTGTSHLTPGSDFDPVRGRADFQELVKRPPGKKPPKEQAPTPRPAK